jgi:hypothetical protein
MVARKSGFKLFFYQKTSFSTSFLLKALIKHHRNRDKPIHDLKNPKNHPKKPKNNPSLDLFF